MSDTKATSRDSRPVARPDDPREALAMSLGFTPDAADPFAMQRWLAEHRTQAEPVLPKR